LRCRRPFERRESQEQHVLCAEEDQIPQLSAVSADHGTVLVWAVVYGQVIEGTA